MLLAILALTMLIYGIFYCCQTYCGCCKQKKKAQKYEEVIVQAPRPQPVEHVVSRVERGDAVVTYGDCTVTESRAAPNHMERRHVQTRQLSPDRNHDHDKVTYSNEVDWAKESRANWEVKPKSHVHVPQNHVVNNNHGKSAPQGHGSRVVRDNSRVVHGDTRVVRDNSRVVEGRSRVHENATRVVNDGREQISNPYNPYST